MTTFASINPVAKLAASAIIAITLVFSLDWVSGSVALGLELLLLPFTGVGPKRLAIRTAPVWIAAIFAGVTIAFYGRASGTSYLHFLYLNVTDGSIVLAIATVVRVLAIALPAVVLFLTVDPTDLADGLAQVLRLPSRFVLGALGAVRLATLFSEDWRSLELARRARGIADRGRVRRFIGQAFALLVLSIRRGSKLATAMEARGFGGPTRRTWARPSQFHFREWLLILISFTIAALAVFIAVATGHWNFLVNS